MVVCWWSAFHDKMSDSNSNTIAMNQRGFVLLSNPYGHAADLWEPMEAEVLAADDGTRLVINAIHKRYDPSVVSHIFEELQALPNKNCSENKLFLNLELQFQVQLTPFSSLDSDVALSGAMAALYLLSTSNVDTAKCISIISTAFPKDYTLTRAPSNNSFIRTVAYESVAKIIRQCDNQGLYRQCKYRQPQLQLFSPQLLPQSNPSASMSNLAMTFVQAKDTRKTASDRLRSDQVCRAKDTAKCIKCCELGHWYADHANDRSLPLDTPSSDCPIWEHQQSVDGFSELDNGLIVARLVPLRHPPMPKLTHLSWPLIWQLYRQTPYNILYNGTSGQ